MGWILNISIDREVTLDVAQEIVEDLTPPLRGQWSWCINPIIPQHKWGWAAAVDIIIPRNGVAEGIGGRRVGAEWRIAGAWFSEKYAKATAAALAENLTKRGFSCSVGELEG